VNTRQDCSIEAEILCQLVNFPTEKQIYNHPATTVAKSLGLNAECVEDRPDFACAKSEPLSPVVEELVDVVSHPADANIAYLTAVENSFGSEIDYAMLVKIYGTNESEETRYSPADCLGAIPTVVSDSPNPKHVSTSFVERQDLTMRMMMRRFTRLTNGFSKKIENHAWAIALHYMHYNFCRIHQTLRVTPAMAAGVTDHVWEISEIVELLEKREEKLAA